MAKEYCLNAGIICGRKSRNTYTPSGKLCVCACVQCACARLCVRVCAQYTWYVLPCKNDSYNLHNHTNFTETMRWCAAKVLRIGVMFNNTSRSRGGELCQAWGVTLCDREEWVVNVWHTHRKIHIHILTSTKCDKLLPTPTRLLLVVTNHPFVGLD